ncbi:MAG TPA: hypothetical protein VF068_13640 [Rubrobacter sp.]
MALRSSNRKRNAWADDLLGVEPTDRVLEIGFGLGIAVRELSRRARHCLVCGVDHSAGIIFVVLMLTATFFATYVPDADAPRQEIADYLADGANDTRNIIGVCMWVVGALAFGREEPKAWQDGNGRAGSHTIRTGG